MRTACLEKMRSLTSIDYNDAVAMLDDPTKYEGSLKAHAKRLRSAM